MRLHPMPEFGSFTLLLALALSVYTLVMGGLALWRSRGSAAGTDGAAARLGETARRAGIASFIALSCAAFALVWAAFTNDFSVEYIRSAHEHCAESCVQVCCAVERPGRLAAAVGVAAERLWICAADAAPGGCAADGVCVDDMAGIQVFFLLLLNYCARRRFRLRRGRLRRMVRG